MGIIFISYRSTDREFVLRLADDIVKAGGEIWLDVREITGRKPYWNEIQEGVEKCSHFLFIISPDSIAEDSGALTELYHAAGLKPMPTIVPVVKHSVSLKTLPILISPGRYQIHDFATQAYDVMLPHVLAALGLRQGVPSALVVKEKFGVRRLIVYGIVSLIAIVLLGGLFAITANNNSKVTPTGIPTLVSTLTERPATIPATSVPTIPITSTGLSAETQTPMLTIGLNATSTHPDETPIPSSIANALTEIGIDPTSGHLVAQINKVVLNGVKEDPMTIRDLSGTYKNLVMGATINGEGNKASDECGFIFRELNHSSFYNTSLVYGFEYFVASNALFAGRWVSLGTSPAFSKYNFPSFYELILVAVKDRFTTYVGRDLIIQAKENTFASGSVALYITTRSNKFACSFEDIWLFSLN